MSSINNTQHLFFEYLLFLYQNKLTLLPSLKKRGNSSPFSFQEKGSGDEFKESDITLFFKIFFNEKLFLYQSNSPFFPLLKREGTLPLLFSREGVGE